MWLQPRWVAIIERVASRQGWPLRVVPLYFNRNHTTNQSQKNIRPALGDNYSHRPKWNLQPTILYWKEEQYRIAIQHFVYHLKTKRQTCTYIRAVVASCMLKTRMMPATRFAKHPWHPKIQTPPGSACRSLTSLPRFSCDSPCSFWPDWCQQH